MKRSIFLLLLTMSTLAFCQNSKKFEGYYLVNGMVTGVEGVGVGYTQQIEPTYISVNAYGDQIILRNFAGIDSIVAETKSDSFFVAENTYEFGDCTYHIWGSGKVLNDTLHYQYFFGSGCIEGVFRFDCVGVKDEENSLAESQRSESIMICYPNPLSRYIIIDLNIPVNVEIVTMAIYQGDGRLKKLFKLNDRGEFNHRIDIKELSEGVFYACIFFDNKRKYCCKIVKQASAD